MSLSKSSLVLVLAAAFALETGSAVAADHPTPEQMEAVKACAAKQGVTLPEPPKGPPPSGEAPSGKNDQAGSPPPPPKDGGQGGPRHMTEAQKAVVDACFKSLGLTPPQPPQGGSHGGQGDKSDK